MKKSIASIILLFMIIGLGYVIYLISKVFFLCMIFVISFVLLLCWCIHVLGN